MYMSQPSKTTGMMANRAVVDPWSFQSNRNSKVCITAVRSTPRSRACQMLAPTRVNHRESSKK